MKTNFTFDKPLFPKSSLHRTADAPLFPPYSIILANKGIRENDAVLPAIKGAFENKGLRQGCRDVARRVSKLATDVARRVSKLATDAACHVSTKTDGARPVSTETSFLPHSTNKTTAVAEIASTLLRPHYLIKTAENEVIRLFMRGVSFSTVVVLSGKLGGNEVFSRVKIIKNQIN